MLTQSFFVLLLGVSAAFSQISTGGGDRVKTKVKIGLCSLPNEFWNECASACGEKTCIDPPTTAPVMCPAVCKQACTCKSGYIRLSPKGPCVKQCALPQPLNSRPKRQAPTPSILPSPIPLITCANILCKENTRCVEGNGSPRCVPIDDSSSPSPQQCMENAEWSNCKSACEPQCGQPENKPCIEICLTGCKCKNGFKLSKDGSRCVKSCGEGNKCKLPNEKWDDCGSGCGERTCADKPQKEPTFCPAVCRPGCYCARGWVRRAPGGACVRSCSSLPPLIPLNVTAATTPSSLPARKKRQTSSRPDIVPPSSTVTCANVRCAGNCIDTKQGPRCLAPEVTGGPITIQPANPTLPTPQKCMENAEWSDCVSSCEPQCGQPDNRICDMMCRTGCKCSDGFKLSKDGKSCVKSCDEDNSTGGDTGVSKDPRDAEKQCPANEFWSNCHSACEPSCEQPTPTICTLQCKMGCGCLANFFRNSEGRCVTLAECKTSLPASGPSCATVKCSKGRWCEMVDTTSGNQVPMCVTKNACAATTCMRGEECRLLQVQCIRAPCEPIAQCVKPGEH